MLDDFLELFEYNGLPAERVADGLKFGDKVIAVRDDIPRFTPDMSYSSGNFSRLREEHATLQMDSRNGTTDRRDTILERTGWPAEFFKGKTILECGCGAGPDAEILLGLGAKVVSVDIAGVDVAKRNVGARPGHALVQASIMDLPLKRKSFDIVFCHRVIMHTPDPEATLAHILQFVKPDGAALVHSYARSFQQMFRWKYALRPFTKGLDAEKLYQRIESYAPMAFKLTNSIRKLPGGKYFNYVCVPFFNYRHVPQLKTMSDEQIIEYGVHDTFDALSPAFDNPLSVGTLRKHAEKHLQQPFEIFEHPSITLLRSKVPAPGSNAAREAA